VAVPPPPDAAVDREVLSLQVLQSEAPNLHIGKFVADGSCLVSVPMLTPTHTAVEGARVCGGCAVYRKHCQASYQSFFRDTPAN
jgi:hypothetical protein